MWPSNKLTLPRFRPKTAEIGSSTPTTLSGGDAGPENGWMDSYTFRLGANYCGRGLQLGQLELCCVVVVFHIFHPFH